MIGLIITLSVVGYVLMVGIVATGLVAWERAHDQPMYDGEDFFDDVAPVFASVFWPFTILVVVGIGIYFLLYHVFFKWLLVFLTGLFKAWSRG